MNHSRTAHNTPMRRIVFLLLGSMFSRCRGIICCSLASRPAGLLAFIVYVPRSAAKVGVQSFMTYGMFAPSTPLSILVCS